MVSLDTSKAPYPRSGKTYVEGVCLSTDTKPTDNIANGSQIVEMDTGNIYMFDEDAGEWRNIS